MGYRMEGAHYHDSSLCLGYVSMRLEGALCDGSLKQCANSGPGCSSYHRTDALDNVPHPRWKGDGREREFEPKPRCCSFDTLRHTVRTCSRNLIRRRVHPIPLA